MIFALLQGGPASGRLFLQKGIDKPVAMEYHQVEVSDD